MNKPRGNRSLFCFTCKKFKAFKPTGEKIGGMDMYTCSKCGYKVGSYRKAKVGR